LKINRNKLLLSLLGITITAGLTFFVVRYRENFFPGFDLPLQAGNVVVEMYRDEYKPSQVKIQQGTTITFVNKSDVARWPASDLHPSHGIYPEFDPKRPIAPGEEWNFVFDKVGEWTMHDHLAPYITGRVIVK